MQGISLEKTMKPLTDEERALAEKYHYIIAHVLHQNRLTDEFYGEVILYYLNAAQRYLASKELQQYSFVTIANRAVEGAIKNYWAKHYRQPQTLSLDVNGTDSENSAFYNIIELQTDDIEKLFDDDTTAIKRQAVAEAKEQLSETQFEIFSLLADGLSQKEIAQTLGKGGSIGSKLCIPYRHTKPPHRATQRAYKQHNRHSA